MANPRLRRLLLTRLSVVCELRRIQCQRRAEGAEANASDEIGAMSPAEAREFAEGWAELKAELEALAAE